MVRTTFRSNERNPVRTDDLRVVTDRCFLLGTDPTTLAAQRRSWCIVHWIVWFPWMRRSKSLLGDGVEFRTVPGSLSLWGRVEQASSLLAHCT